MIKSQSTKNIVITTENQNIGLAKKFLWVSVSSYRKTRTNGQPNTRNKKRYIMILCILKRKETTLYNLSNII